MKRLISLALVFALALTTLLCGCGERAEVVDGFTIATVEDDVTKAAIDKTLNSFAKAYEENDAASVMPLIASTFGATEEQIKTFFTDIHNDTGNAKFVPYDRYYMTGIKSKEGLVDVKHKPEDEMYITLSPTGDELCAAFYLAEGEKTSFMLSLMLVREGDEFKIGFITPSLYKYNGEMAPAIFEKTLALKNAGKTISAYIYSCILGSSYRPGGYMRYENDETMQSLCYELYAEILEKYPLPLALTGTTNTTVYQISITNDNEAGTIPLILARTDTPITDKAALETECGKIAAAIEALSPGLRETFTAVCFELTNDTITEETQNPKTETVIYNLTK